mgnify:CR=1 FL=1
MATPLISLTLLGNPVAKARPRVTRTRQGKSLTYTPDKTVRATQAWQALWMASKPLQKPLTGPLALSLTFYMSRPKTAPKKRLYPMTKPDLKNMLALVEDALEGLAYFNDSQIISLNLVKHYAVYPDVPRTELILYSCEEPL